MIVTLSKKFSVLFIIIGIIFFIIGALVAGNNNFIATIILYILGILLIMVNGGVELDYENCCAREFTALGPVRFGTWVKFEIPLQIAIAPATLISRRTGYVMQTSTTREQTFKLVVKTNQRKYLVLKYSNDISSLEKIKDGVERAAAKFTDH